MDSKVIEMQTLIPVVVSAIEIFVLYVSQLFMNSHSAVVNILKRALSTENDFLLHLAKNGRKADAKEKRK